MLAAISVTYTVSTSLIFFDRSIKQNKKFRSGLKNLESPGHGLAMSSQVSRENDQVFNKQCRNNGGPVGKKERKTWINYQIELS